MQRRPTRRLGCRSTARRPLLIGSTRSSKGAARRCAAGCCTRSLGPSSAVTMSWNRSAAAPASRAATSRSVADSTSATRPPTTSISAPRASTTSRQPRFVARSGQPVDRLAHLEGIARRTSEHLVHVGEESARDQPGAAGHVDDAVSEFLRPVQVGHERPVAELDVHDQRVKTGSELLGEDRGGDQRDRFHRGGDIADRIEAPIGRR